MKPMNPHIKRAAENMARGKLIILSDVGSLREVIGDTGLWFAAGDAAGLASCMKRVLDDATVATHLGGKERRRASEQFDRDKMLLQHFQVYREAVRCDE
jgi:glycosyltransferase involved in cell wall biosynthesis